jgi:hypothetical protein
MISVSLSPARNNNLRLHLISSKNDYLPLSSASESHLSPSGPVVLKANGG